MAKNKSTVHSDSNQQIEIEKKLWQAADELRANSKLRSSEYSPPVLDLIFLRYASEKFEHLARDLEKKQSRRRESGPTDYHALGAIYLPDASRFDYLLKLPEGSDNVKEDREVFGPLSYESKWSLMVIVRRPATHSGIQ